MTKLSASVRKPILRPVYAAIVLSLIMLVSAVAIAFSAFAIVELAFGPIPEYRTRTSSGVTCVNVARDTSHCLTLDGNEYLVVNDQVFKVAPRVVIYDGDLRAFDGVSQVDPAIPDSHTVNGNITLGDAARFITLGDAARFTNYNDLTIFTPAE